MPGFDALIKFRCYQSLVDRINRLAAKHRRTSTDFLRMITEDYADAEEKRLGLSPITPAEIEQYSVIEDKPTARPIPKPRPVRYSRINLDSKKK